MNINNNNKIYYTPENKISFNAIRLNEKELLESQKLLHKYIKAPESGLDSLKNEAFKLFEKHLCDEINLKTKKYYIKEDFAQDFYLKFFIFLDEIRNKILSPDEFISKLNEIKPDNDSIKSGVCERSINETFNGSLLEKGNLLTEENLPVYYNMMNFEKKQNLTDKLAQLVNQSFLKEKEKEVFHEYNNGVKVKDIANNLASTYSRISGLKRAAIRKMQYMTGNLSIAVDEIANELKSKYKLEHSLKKIIDLFLSTQQLVTIEKDKLFENISKISRLLNIEEKEFVKAALEQPNLFYQHPETLYNNIKNSSKLFKVSEETFVKAALKHPQLFYQNSETLYQNINNTAQKFNIDKDILVKAAFRHPALFCLKTETLFKNIVNSSEIFNVSKEAFIKPGLKSPNLFIQKAETLYENVNRSVKLFNVNMDDYIKAALRQPQLFYQKPETLYKNIKETAAKFDIDIEKLIEAAMKHPSLFYQKPETLYRNISEAAKLLNIDKKDIIELGLKQPNLFSRKPQVLYEKNQILHYINKLKGQENSKFHYSAESDDVLYQKLLTYLIKKYLKLDKLNPKDLINTLKTFPASVYKFELPEHELNDEFIRFTKNFFKENLSESNVEFLVKKA